MAATPTAPQATDAEHEAEAAQQAEIAAAVEPVAPVADKPSPVAPEADKVKLRSKNVDVYPLSVSVVGVEDELVFENESATVEVSPEVAEQVTYLPNVEVVA
jgi:hypothetical protein